MPEGFVTESEAEYIRTKPKNMEKFQAVFDFYHETVPKDASASEQPKILNDEGNTGVQQVDPPSDTTPPES